MYPEDRVLVGVMPRRRDLELARDEHWYRIPKAKAPKGLYSEYIAFYFTRAFDEHKYSVRYYARRTGLELVRRRELLPDEPRHPRANAPYYKLQLGPLRAKEPPILSLRWRRITFIHTTWDRFIKAEEINDLFSADDEFVDRVYYALRDSNLRPERLYKVKERGIEYVVDFAWPCRDGLLTATVGGEGPRDAVQLERGPASPASIRAALATLRRAIRERGGLRTVDVPLESA